MKFFIRRGLARRGAGLYPLKLEYLLEKCEL